jgi:hypothetical protein
MYEKLRVQMSADLLWELAIVCVCVCSFLSNTLIQTIISLSMPDIHRWFGVSLCGCVCLINTPLNSHEMLHSQTG